MSYYLLAFLLLLPPVQAAPKPMACGCEPARRPVSERVPDGWLLPAAAAVYAAGRFAVRR